MLPTIENCCTADKNYPPWFSFEKKGSEQQRGCSLKDSPFLQTSWFPVPEGLGNTIYASTQFSIFTFTWLCSGPDSCMFSSPYTWVVKIISSWTHQILRP